jgi:GT2 family glycosyltransferase
VIPSKDNPAYLANCIASLARYCCDVPFEIVVVDSGSTTPQVGRLQRQLVQELSVTWVDCDQSGNFNFPELVNAGVAAAKGTYVVLLNDDTEALHHGWLESMLEIAEGDDPESVVGALLLYPDMTVQHAGVRPDQQHVTSHRDVGMPYGDWRKEIAESAPQVWAVTGAAMLVRRELYLDLGGFDRNYAVSYNDIDFLLRAKMRGSRCRLSADSVLVHFESKTRGSDAQSQVKTVRHLRESLAFLARWSGSLLDVGIDSEELRRRFEDRLRVINDGE